MTTHQIRHRRLARHHRRRLHLRQRSPRRGCHRCLCSEARRRAPRRGRRLRHSLRFATRCPQSLLKFLPAPGFPVKLANDYTPTPAISLAVKQLGAAGGVVITSSHNPVELEWSEVQGQVRRLGDARDHEGDRRGAARRRDAKRPESRDRRSGSETGLRRDDLPLRRSGADRESEVQVCRRFHVRLRTRRADQDLSAITESTTSPSARN